MIMRTIDVLSKFLELFPYYQETICSYVVTGPNSIVATMRNGENIRFTYFNDYNWRISDKWMN